MDMKNLKKKYPHVFKEKLAIPGFDVGEGWHPMIEQGLRAINWRLESNADYSKRNKKENPTKDFQILQIKEKFGTLRFYTANFDDYIIGIVSMMENMSEITCEKCGHQGKLCRNGWLVTLCDKCEEKHASRD